MSKQTTKGEAKAFQKELIKRIEPQHTPTPWKLNEFGDLDIPNTDENVAFIVRAVNAHEGLLGLLKEVNEFFDNNQSVSPSAVMSGEKTIHERFTEAIAKAEQSSIPQSGEGK